VLPDDGMQEVRSSNLLSSTNFLRRSEGVLRFTEDPFSDLEWLPGAKREPTASRSWPQPSRVPGVSALAEDGIHGFGVLCDHWPELMPIDPGGDGGVLVAHQVGNGLDGHAVVAHDRDERVAQLARSPVLPDTSGPGDGTERTADVAGGEPRLADERMSSSACLVDGLKMARPWPTNPSFRGRDPGAARGYLVTVAGSAVSRQAASPPGRERRRCRGLRSAGAGRMGMRASYFVVDRWLGAGRWLSLTGIAGE
jgi:hypothetical protein